MDNCVRGTRMIWLELYNLMFVLKIKSATIDDHMMRFRDDDHSSDIGTILHINC